MRVLVPLVPMSMPIKWGMSDLAEEGHGWLKSGEYSGTGNQE